MYACFISYCRGQYDLTRSFVDQLTKALMSSLEPWMNETVYLDQQNLGPGAQFNEELARALCESVCMLMVYSPSYRNHLYCRREYLAMRRIEARRRKLLGESFSRAHGMLIPVILRGDANDIPEEIRRNTMYSDFSRYTTATPSIRRNAEYVRKIETIAQFIDKQRQTVAGINACADCASFVMPSEQEVDGLWGTQVSRYQSFPGH